MTKARKKSPRAPSIGLEEAISKAEKIYKKEGKHEVPAELAAQDMGYSGKNSGAALGALAALKAFGLLDATKPGHVAISPSFEEYLYVPDGDTKRMLLREWAVTPPLFAYLVGAFPERPPSEGALKHQLIKNGFTPQGLGPVVKSFTETIIFSDFYRSPEQRAPEVAETADTSAGEEAERNLKVPVRQTAGADNTVNTEPRPTAANVDRIPIRLKGGRRAWVEIPVPFYEEDKEVIRAQIAVIVADEPKEPPDIDIEDLV